VAGAGRYPESRPEARGQFQDTEAPWRAPERERPSAYDTSTDLATQPDRGEGVDTTTAPPSTQALTEEPEPWDRGESPYTRDSKPAYDTTPYTPGAATTEAATRSAEPPAARELAYTFYLFDGLEKGNHWAVESAADRAELALSEDHVSEGQKALSSTFKAFGKGNFELRREVGLDLSKATTVLVDVYNDAGPMDLAVGFRAGYDNTLFTTSLKSVNPGWNKDLTFSIADLTSTEGGAYGTSWAWNRDSVSRVSLIFHEREQKQGTVFVDNLRFDRRTDELGLKIRPVIKGITASGKSIERFEAVELTVDFEADYQDFFDRTQVDLLGTFFAPSGKRYEVHGFVYGIDEAATKPTWKIRFAPTEIGLWRYDVTVKDAGGTTTSQTYELLCRRRASHRGFIRVSKADPRYFEFDDGTFYYPVGQNVCWASDYDQYLERIQSYGGNYVRVWLCPWNLQLEDPTEPGKYDLRTASALDDLLARCRRRGISLQLALRYHGMHDASWDKNPYNAAKGGPCTWPGDFFTDLAAKDLHKRFLDYVVARWGHSTTIFAWELWNEADLARADRDTDLVDWHREMAAYLKKIDLGRHLVTTSVASATRCFKLFELPQIDFVPVHFYAPDVYVQIFEHYLRYRKLRKPIFIGEFSAGHKPSDDLADARGVRLHAGLWLAFVTPLAGNAMPWWWDTYVEKNKLYFHWAALTRFAQGIDRRGKNHELVRSRIRLGDDTWANIQGLVSPSEALLWVYDEARIAQPEHADRPLLIAERPVRLEGMLGGTFRVEVWDTHEGKPLRRATAKSADGALEFVLPKCSRDVAVKVTRLGEARPILRW